MKTLSRGLSEKLHKLMPEVLDDCEWWYNHYHSTSLKVDEWRIEDYQKRKIDSIPALNIEDILDSDFLGSLIASIRRMKLNKSYLGSMTSDELDNMIISLIVDITGHYIDGKLPAVEKYLEKLLKGEI